MSPQVVPDTRIWHAAEITGLRWSAHCRAVITTVWDLGARQATGDERFRQWAHMLGSGGHFLTKSRRYSVTFGQLCTARTSYRRAQLRPTVNATRGAEHSTSPSS